LSHLASLLTVTSLIRNLPVLVKSKNQLNIPSDVCERHGIVEEQVLRQGAEAKGLKDAIYEIGTRGMDEMITARREVKGMICDDGVVDNKETKSASGRIEPKVVRPLFLSAVSGPHTRREAADDPDPRRGIFETP
jgi:NADH dehydrogenase [ubiquinone] 1 alpha subcomplex assembly factor 6